MRQGHRGKQLKACPGPQPRSLARHTMEPGCQEIPVPCAENGRSSCLLLRMLRKCLPARSAMQQSAQPQQSRPVRTGVTWPVPGGGCVQKGGPEPHEAGKSGGPGSAARKLPPCAVRTQDRWQAPLQPGTAARLTKQHPQRTGWLPRWVAGVGPPAKPPFRCRTPPRSCTAEQ